MHPQFSRWYSTAELTKTQAVLDSRWKAVAALAKAATLADVDTLLRVAFRLRPGTMDGTPRLRSVLTSADPSFEAGGNNRELEILVGATLVALFDQASAAGRSAALAVSTGSIGGTRKPIIPIDLAGLAEAAITKQAEIARSRASEYVAPRAPKIDFTAAATKAKEGNSFENVSLAFTQAAEALTTALKGFVEETQTTFDDLQSQLLMQDEELDMLWWLVGARSWGLDCSFSAVAKEAAPIVFASELASLTKHLPGPAAVGPLLSRAGVDESDLALTEAVNATSLAWLRTACEGRAVSPVLHPLHHAALRRIETGETSAWVAGWAASTEIEASQKLSALRVAQQFFRERVQLLLVKE